MKPKKLYPRRFFAIFAAIALVESQVIHAAPADADDDSTETSAKPGKGNKGGGNDIPFPPGNDKTLANYQVAAASTNIGITPPTQPPTDTKVYGEPRNTAGHPCTLLDKDDIDALKKGLTSNTEMKDAFDRLKKEADARITQDLGVPIAQKAADGTWMWPGDLPGLTKKIDDVSDSNAKAMANLAMMYQLTGDAKYGEYAKKMLMAYADNYNNYGHPKGWTPAKYHSAKDGRLHGQFLTDGIWLCRVAFAYDMIHDLPSWTPQERTHLRDDLFRAVEAEFGDVDGEINYLGAQHNRSCVCTSGVLMSGYACEDDQMINDALYGWKGTKDKPTGGLLKVHFGECILPDGMWIEGAPGYQLGIASCGLFNDAETLWHHGIDMYRFKNGVLKQMLNSMLYLAFPTKEMNLPKLHDSQGEGLLAPIDWLNNEIGVPYECGYRRYQEAHWLPIIRNATKELEQTIHGGPVSLFLDLPPQKDDPPPVSANANFYSVGDALLRLPNNGSYNEVLMECGPSAGHAHPSKLAIDLFALGTDEMPLPGVIFPYNNPLDFSWFWTTPSNCTMGVDGLPQLYSKNKFRNRDAGDPVAIQVVYGPASTMGIQRAWSNSIQPGITEDRAVFLTSDYFADLFGGFDTALHSYSLYWHPRGKITSSLKTDAFQFPSPVPPGDNAIENPTHASTDQPWTATITTPNNQTLHFVAAGGTPTDVIFGTGHFMTNKQDEKPPVFLQRRAGVNEALFGNAVDLSGSPDGVVKSVKQEGSLSAGYGLLTIATTRGSDLCFAAYRPGSYTAAGMTTDGLQAFVRSDGNHVYAMYLAGGTSLKAGDGKIERSEPGLAYVEKTVDGKYIVGNPTSAPTTVTVTLPALGGMKAYKLDAQGTQTGPATTAAGAAPGSFKLTLDPQATVEFAGS